MKRILFPFLFVSTCLCTVNAQVVLNEFSASNLESLEDSFGKTEDWIELYNQGSSTVDLSGWTVSDKLDNPAKYELPTGSTIQPSGTLLIYCSGRDGLLNGEIHSNFKLSQTKSNETITLANNLGQVIDSRPLGLTLVEHSHCRDTDGSGVWRICTTPSPNASNSGASIFLRYTDQPTFSMEAGFYTGMQQVEITNMEPNSTLHYTIDGTNPTQTSPVYTSPIAISATTVVKARAFSNSPEVLPGKLTFATYFIDEDFSLAVFSIAADQLIDLANGDGDIIPIGSLEYFDIDKKLAASSFGSLNRHGQDSWILDHRSLDWISRDEMGYSRAVEAKLFNNSDRDEYQKFMFRNSGDDNYPAISGPDHRGSTHIRDEYVHTLSKQGGLKLDIRAVERVIVFLNGEYWGVYGMRERPVDHDYTKEYYNQGKYDIQYLSTWETTEAEYGGQQAIDDWINLRDFILENDMSIEENYGLAADSLNMTSLVDYFLLNLNTVAADWLNYNTGWWRGRDPEGDHKKWGYIVWDLDATFDYYINYTGIPNTGPDALVCDIEEISTSMDSFFEYATFDSTQVSNCASLINGEVPYSAEDKALQLTMGYDPICCDMWGSYCQETYNYLLEELQETPTTTFGNVGQHEKIFLKLIEESPSFKQLYYSRYADVANSVFSCENMTRTLDSMVATITPEMPRQIERWGGNLQTWERNVTNLRGFIETRCEVLAENLTECYDELSGPYQVTLLTEPNGIGEIDFNSLDIETFPWSGSYFGGMDNNIKAKVFDRNEDQYTFSHWESKAGNDILPNTSERRANILINTNDTLVAVFKNNISSTQDLFGTDKFTVFPNPASEELIIQFTLNESASVSANIQTLLGQRISVPTIQNERFEAGNTRIILNLRQLGLSNGFYLLSLQSESKTSTVRFEVFR